MRILEYKIILETAFLLGFLMLLMLGNIYLHVNKRQNHLTKGFHITSFFWFTGLFCLFIQTVILDLSFEKYFEHIGKLSIVSGTVCGIVTLGIYLYSRQKAIVSAYMLPDFASLLSKTNDLVIISDFNGKIIEINQMVQRQKVLGESVHDLEALYHAWIDQAPVEQSALIEAWHNMNLAKHQFEIQLQDQFYWVQSCPLFTNRNNYLGTVIVLHDIREEKDLREAINQQNTSLEKANKKLVEYVGVAEVLESEKIRLQCLQEVQIGLAKDIEAVIDHINGIAKKKAEDTFTYSQEVAEIATKLRTALKAIRQSIHTMTGRNN